MVLYFPTRTTIMKNIIKTLLILNALMLVGACASTPTMKDVFGTYELKEGETSIRIVLLENGKAEHYSNDKKDVESRWELADAEIHIKPTQISLFKDHLLVFRINPDNSLSAIGMIDPKGKRIAGPETKQPTFIKIR